MKPLPGILKTGYINYLFCLPFCWCPCMAIKYDGGFLPDIILFKEKSECT